MILSVLMLGGAMLGATAIAGLLMLFQIRQSADFQSSAKSIFGADAGVEWALENTFQSPTPLPSFSNGVLLDVTCYDASGNQLDCSNGSSTSAISRGTVGGTKRAFLVKLDGATSTFP